MLAQYMFCKVIVAPQRPIGYHHSFGEPCGATSVVDERQFVATLFWFVFYVLWSEILWIFLSEIGIQILPGICERIGA